MFVVDHESGGIDENNQPVKLKNNVAGWFIGERYTGDEVLFHYKSYSIAIGSDKKDIKEMLIDFANDLQIWK